MKRIITEGGNGNLQPETEKREVLSRQSKRREAVEEVSLDKDRQKDRISLSQSRGRGDKRRL